MADKWVFEKVGKWADWKVALKADQSVFARAAPWVGSLDDGKVDRWVVLKVVLKAVRMVASSVV